MDYDKKKVDEMVLALMWLVTHSGGKDLLAPQDRGCRGESPANCHSGKAVHSGHSQTKARVAGRSPAQVRPGRRRDSPLLRSARRGRHGRLQAEEDLNTLGLFQAG